MNWPKLMAEYRLVAAWLSSAGSGDAGHDALRIIAAVLRGCQTPEAAVQAALQRTCGDMPDAVHGIIGRWQLCLPRDPLLLGEFYERTAYGRKALGLYYTPPEAVNFILRHTVANCDIVANPGLKILDPACGCGYFLLAAYELLWQKYRANRDALAALYPDEDWSDDGIHRRIVCENLWGADIDPVAAEIAALGLFLKRPQANACLRPHIVICDSLRRLSDLEAEAEDKAFWRNHYDFVIGNPPYLSFGLRGSARLEAGYADYLRDVFKESAEYKLSYYVLFMQRGIELLAPGGKLGFIVPDSFLLGRYFSKIRKYILDNTRIDVLAHISSPVFKRATVGMSAICILSREENAAKREEAVIQVYNAQSVEGMEQAEPVSRYPQRYFASLLHYRFRLFFDLAAKNLVDKLEATGKPLSNFAKGHTGVRSLTRQADLIASAPGGATWKPGLVSGSQVYRYGIDYQGHWLNIDPGMLYKGGWQSEIIEQRKILVRQTGFSLTAAIDDQGYYHLNNIHSFVLCNDCVSLDYLLLLLNSRLMAFYYHVTSAEYGRAMAQTDIETLELLPVKVHPEINRQAPELVAAMTALTRRERKGEADAGYKAAALNEYLNQLVYRIYELCETEVEYIENYERKLVCQGNNRRRKQTQKQQS